jgi:hypothetical protein
MNSGASGPATARGLRSLVFSLQFHGVPIKT